MSNDSPNIIVTYDKFSKKVSEKWMTTGIWSIVLDIDVDRLGKYIDDFLYSSRKMAQNIG